MTSEQQPCALLEPCFKQKRPRPRPTAFQRCCCLSWTPLLCFLLTLLVSLETVAPANTADTLSTDSVVLITGAAGFLGSELAMALGNVYNVRKIICIDVMATTPHLLQTEEEQLSLFEFQRQRAFHVMQSLQTKVHFFRSDLAPSLPEYFDLGEVPLLEYIFRQHPDISHIVHLADPPVSQYMAVPRVKESIKAGLLESIMEQAMKQEHPPHLLFASSYEVYNHNHDSTMRPPFSEEEPITVPSSLHGASKVLDEILAKAYYDAYGLFSIGVRLFPVYGPWGVPGSPLFEMAERAVSGEGPILNPAEQDIWDDVRDYIYIDDAIDALLMAMQVRTPNNTPFVVNVGTGKGTSLRDVARQMQELIPRSSADDNVPRESSSSSSTPTVSFASTERAKQLLGFQPQVSLKDGLIKLLAWHYDRAFPYGGGDRSPTSIASQGIVSCSPFDRECLKGTPVFPCASECSHETQCTTSYYDDVLLVTRSLTASCPAVMYTVALDQHLLGIPSANMAGTTEQASHLPEHCNIAFVSESSSLVQRLKPQQGFSSSSTVVEDFLRQATKSSNGKSKKKVLKHGFWTLVPVWTPSFETGDEPMFRLLPKLSPGLFFGKATQHAIYCDPDVIFRSVPALLREAQMQPYREGLQGATAMLVARERSFPVSAFGAATQRRRRRAEGLSNAESVQNAAYRMIRIGVIDDMLLSSSPGDGHHHSALLDSSWLVHTLHSEDSRLFRCDVLGEVVQWNVAHDESALAFIMELHDMWSRVIVKGKGLEPWWIGDAVVTVPQQMTIARVYDERQDIGESRRRLDQVENNDVDVGDEEGVEDEEEQANSKKKDDSGETRNEKELVADADVDRMAKSEEQEGVADDKDEEVEEEERETREEEEDHEEVQSEEEKEGEETEAKDELDGPILENVRDVRDGADDSNGADDKDGGEEGNENADKSVEEEDDQQTEEDGERKSKQDETKDGEGPEEKEGDREGADRPRDDVDVVEVDAEAIIQKPKDGYEEQQQQDSGETGSEDEDHEKDKAFAANGAVPDGNDAPVEGHNEGFLGDINEDVDTGEAEQAAISAEEVGDSREEDEDLITDDDEAEEEDDESDEEGLGPDSETNLDEEDEEERDISVYDSWMGVLSSTSINYFVRIVPSSEVGAFYLDDYEY